MMSIKDFQNEYNIHFTLKHTGKMSGMASLSTSVIENKRCQARAKVAGSICEKCFAANMFKRYGQGFTDCFAKNTEVLTSHVIPVREWPVLNCKVFRLESFGDIQNIIQVINYFNLCKANKGTTFALWTKNPDIIAAAITAGEIKPKNLIIIQSSSFINKAENKRYDFIDKVFTVYSKEYISENNVNITCGARNCLECGRCYTRRTSDIVSEQLK